MSYLCLVELNNHRARVCMQHSSGFTALPQKTTASICAWLLVGRQRKFWIFQTPPVPLGASPARELAALLNRKLTILHMCVPAITSPTRVNLPSPGCRYVLFMLFFSIRVPLLDIHRNVVVVRKHDRIRFLLPIPIMCVLVPAYMHTGNTA